MRRTTLASIVVVTAGLPAVAAACRGSATAPSPAQLLAGTYELQLELGCEALPTAVLDGAEFFSGRGRFQGTVEPDRVKLSLADLRAA